LEEGLALYDPERDRAKASRLGFDARMACHSWLGFVLWNQGFPDQALAHTEEAIVASRAAAHPLSEAWALSWAGMLHQLRGDVRLCRERAEAALALAIEQVLPFYVMYAKVYGGWALVKQGRTEEGLARLRSGLDAYCATGAKLYKPRWRALLADACLDAGRIEEGLSAVREAIAETKETGACYNVAELNRLEGELLLAPKEPDESGAEASFREAIAIGRGQGAKSFELRAATSVARFWLHRGRRIAARDLLAPVYSWFTEGFDTVDLKEAKALLDELMA
jgi:predicted ATPase